MVLRVYNTLTRELENFEPMVGDHVNMYVCGPTVYDDCHLGHARSYVAFDVIRRYLRYSGYDVKYIMNITDIDDKIIQRATRSQEDPLKLAAKFTDSFLEDMERLNIHSPDVQPKVTDHINEIINIISGLIDGGFAYVTSKGNVYFNLLSSQDKIGILSHQTLQGLLEGSGYRVGVEDDKRHQLDFALWKSSDETEIGWESPWSKGRPGWHIECTAMAVKYSGGQLDIHGGGMDLVFPHHEAEILQSEAYTGRGPFSKYWMHNGFLTIDKEKMSKSLDNFFTIKDVLKRYSPETIRFFLVYTHYRSTIDFSDDNLQEAEQAVKRVQTAFENSNYALINSKEDAKDHGLLELVSWTRNAIKSAMNEDFNTREALGHLFVFIRKLNPILSKTDLSYTSIEHVVHFFEEIDDIFGILVKNNGQERDTKISSDEIESLILIREQARGNKDWATADQIRDQLQEKGVVIEDSKNGTRWKWQ
ncbi:cysteine--tRNA ligase [Methanosalsum natronophilum]|nr:cysteine--tRNA ligase [Methanosalsum natronophilum]MCS3923658.1 cysteinyl-tRNA synthetase [Methanosalsum natronophilum]